MLLMLAVITVNIILRPFGSSIRGTVEVSGYLCALAVGLCMPAAQLAGSHITAGLWESSLPPFLRQLLNPFGNLLCAFLLLLAAKELGSIADYARDMGEYIEGFNISYYGMAMGLAAGVALHGLLFFHGILRFFFTKSPDGASGRSLS